MRDCANGIECETSTFNEDIGSDLMVLYASEEKVSLHQRKWSFISFLDKDRR